MQRSMRHALADQQQVLNTLIRGGQRTRYGQSVRLDQVSDYESFKSAVPVQDYEAFRPWVEQIKAGQENVLWKGRPLYFAKTSGTTSGVKYIPITRDSIPNHIQTARNALLCYMAETGNSAFADGKMIFLSGSPELERVGGIPTGRLSGIVNHHIPSYLRTNQLPSYPTNCIEDWEAKLQRIVEETWDQPMSLISGIPPWMQMYFDALTLRTGKKIGDLFPRFQVMVQGGVNFEPYRTRLMESIGRRVDTIELFPASEGFFAFQDSQQTQGLLLNTNSGIFFEFVPFNATYFDEEGNIKDAHYALTLEEVQEGVNYAMIISTNAGLWRYLLGDTIKFTNVKQREIKITGRTKQYLSVTGEHLSLENMHEALRLTGEQLTCCVEEFTVCSDKQTYQHQWFISLDKEIDNALFQKTLDANLSLLNDDYKSVRKYTLPLPEITFVQSKIFYDFMEKSGKLGAQNKFPRVMNENQQLLWKAFLETQSDT